MFPKLICAFVCSLSRKNIAASTVVNDGNTTRLLVGCSVANAIRVVNYAHTSRKKGRELVPTPESEGIFGEKGQGVPAGSVVDVALVSSPLKMCE